MGRIIIHNIPYHYKTKEYQHAYYELKKKGLIKEKLPKKELLPKKQLLPKKELLPKKQKYTLPYNPVTAGSFRKDEDILYEDHKYIFYFTNRIWSKMAEKYIKLQITSRRKYYILKCNNKYIQLKINLADNINEYISENCEVISNNQS